MKKEHEEEQQKKKASREKEKLAEAAMPYSWEQTLKEVTVTLPVPPGTRGKQISCTIKKKHLKIGLKDQQPIIDGELHKEVIPDDGTWYLEDNKAVVIQLSKLNAQEWWTCVIKGDFERDTKLIEPEDSQLSDLDAETRKTVEKMMFDQRQRAMGKPTSEELQKQSVMKKFMEAHPEMDFSQAKMG